MVTADKPILVAQLAKSGLETETNKDPALMIIPPTTQWRPLYTFTTGRMAVDDFQHFVLVAIQKAWSYLAFSSMQCMLSVYLLTHILVD